MIDRRRFLKTTVLAGTGLVGSVRCTTDSQTQSVEHAPNEGDIQRVPRPEPTIAGGRAVVEEIGP